jgi:hypothetical protein
MDVTPHGAIHLRRAVVCAVKFSSEDLYLILTFTSSTLGMGAPSRAGMVGER